MRREPTRVMFVYWGRRGAMTQFTLEVARAAQADARIASTVSISRQNEQFGSYAQLGPALFAVDTFRSGAGAILHAWRIPLLRHRLRQRLRQDRIDFVIELMPHVWSPLVMPVIQSAGVRYCTIIHDAVRHPGDRTGWTKLFTDRSLKSADLVFTLSAAVASRLSTSDMVQPDRITTLFTPDLEYGSKDQRAAPKPGEPLRLLFLGRILPYKGLPLFLDMVDQLQQEGIAVEVGVFGEGKLGVSGKRLEAMNAQVVNRWLTELEIAAILPRFHAIVLSHTEASQSGVAAAALGAGLPIIATPVGGLVEQLGEGRNGELAARADPQALADATKRLLLNPVRYRNACQNILDQSEQRSMARFVEAIVSNAVHSQLGKTYKREPANDC